MSFVGYQDTDRLPIRAGDTVTIPAGVKIGSYNPKRRTRVAARKQTVKVDHVLCGRSTPAGHVATWDRASHYPGHQDTFALFDLAMEMANTVECPVQRRRLYDFAYSVRVPVENPKVRWSGTGYFWCWVDINDLLGVPAQREPDLDGLMAILADGLAVASDVRH